MNSSLNMLSVFPASFFEEKNLTKEELNIAKKDFRLIFNMSDDLKIDITNLNYGDLIKMIALVKRYPRCKKSIDYLIKEFQRLFQSVYKPSYNLVFTMMWPGEITTPMDVISSLKFGKQKFADLTTQDQTICINIRMLMREIHCLTQMFRSTIQSGSYPSIQDLYNYLDRFNEIFKELFNFRVADIRRSGILEPYILLRHAIAHSHFVIEEDGIKLVDWQYRPVKKVRAILKFNLDEIREEMTIISMIFCQIIVLYQLMQQSKNLE